MIVGLSWVPGCCEPARRFGSPSRIVCLDRPDVITLGHDGRQIRDLARWSKAPAAVYLTGPPAQRGRVGIVRRKGRLEAVQGVVEDRPLGALVVDPDPEAGQVRGRPE